MNERTHQAQTESIKTGSRLLTVRVIKTDNREVNPELIRANRRAKKRLAESRAKSHIDAF